jgi:hypothetical protein
MIRPIDIYDMPKPKMRKNKKVIHAMKIFKMVN